MLEMLPSSLSVPSFARLLRDRDAMRYKCLCGQPQTRNSFEIVKCLELRAEEGRQRWILRGTLWLVRMQGRLQG